MGENDNISTFLDTILDQNDRLGKRVHSLENDVKGNGEPGLKEKVRNLETKDTGLSALIQEVRDDFYGKDGKRNGLFYKERDRSLHWGWILGITGIVSPLLYFVVQSLIRAYIGG